MFVCTAQLLGHSLEKIHDVTNIFILTFWGLFDQKGFLSVRTNALLTCGLAFPLSVHRAAHIEALATLLVTWMPWGLSKGFV